MTASKTARPGRGDVAQRIAAEDWARIGRDLDANGAALTGPLLTPAECRALAAGYDAAEGFRSRIVMARHSFGRGEYKYWAYPLPDIVQQMRGALYPPLAAIANAVADAIGVRITELPITPDKVLRALRGEDGKEEAR